IRRAWRHWPYLAFKEPQKMIWNETRARGVDMTIATRMLTMHEEALRDDQVKIVLGSRHGDIEKPSLFFQLSRCAGSQIGWHAAIDDVQRIDRLPFLAFGGMNRGKDQIVLVAQRRA